jgi:hypothetical protein
MSTIARDVRSEIITTLLDVETVRSMTDRDLGYWLLLNIAQFFGWASVLGYETEVWTTLEKLKELNLALRGG